MAMEERENLRRALQRLIDLDADEAAHEERIRALIVAQRAHRADVRKDSMAATVRLLQAEGLEVMADAETARDIYDMAQSNINVYHRLNEHLWPHLRLGHRNWDEPCHLILLAIPKGATPEELAHTARTLEPLLAGQMVLQPGTSVHVSTGVVLDASLSMASPDDAVVEVSGKVVARGDLLAMVTFVANHFPG